MNRNQTKVIVNGTFDILHIGHIRLLEYAKSFPNAFVFVLVDSDERVKQLKGTARPINSLQERLEILSAIRYVDLVGAFDTDEGLRTLIKDYSPDIMVKGSDYRNTLIIGQEFCKEVLFYEKDLQYSSTNKIQKIIETGFINEKTK